jgi:hypothetical protein
MKIKAVKCPLCGEVLMRGFLGEHLQHAHPIESRNHECPKHRKAPLALRAPVTTEPKALNVNAEQKTQKVENPKQKPTKKKRRYNPFAMVVTSAPRGSSMFGGFKPSFVRICSGGLPSLGRRK